MSLLAVDPGLPGCGIAVFADEVPGSDRGRLLHAGYVRNPVPTSATVASRVRAVAQEVVYVAREHGWAHRPPDYAGLVAARLVVEYPKFLPLARRGAKRDADQNDLILMALVSGALIGLANVTEARAVLPYEWKAQAPKEVTEARAKEDLTAAELARIELPAPSLRHNVYDAVGIGLAHYRKHPLNR